MDQNEEGSGPKKKQRLTGVDLPYNLLKISAKECYQCKICQRRFTKAMIDKHIRARSILMQQAATVMTDSDACESAFINSGQSNRGKHSKASKSQGLTASSAPDDMCSDDHGGAIHDDDGEISGTSSPPPLQPTVPPAPPQIPIFLDDVGDLNQAEEEEEEREGEGRSFLAEVLRQMEVDDKEQHGGEDEEDRPMDEAERQAFLESLDGDELEDFLYDLMGDDERGVSEASICQSIYRVSAFFRR